MRADRRRQASKQRRYSLIPPKGRGEPVYMAVEQPLDPGSQRMKIRSRSCSKLTRYA